MIRNLAFNPNPSIYRNNLVSNCNSTGHAKKVKDTRKSDPGVKAYNQMLDLKNGKGPNSNIFDYRVSSTNRVKSLIKTEKGSLSSSVGEPKTMSKESR